MDSQVDVTLVKGGAPAATLTLDRASAHPDITDVSVDTLERWLEDVWAAAKDAWGLDWKKALADVEKLYSDVSGGSNYARAVSANLLLWQGGMVGGDGRPLADERPDKVDLAYHAWSDDDLKQGAFCRVDPSAGSVADTAQSGTHDFRQTIHVPLTGPMIDSFVLSAAACDSGAVFDVSIATALTLSVAPGTGQSARSGYLTQSNFGRAGNFELVTPAAGGGIAHYWRDNDVSPNVWKGPVVFAQELGVVDAVSLIQSGFSGRAAAGKPPIGNLELVARAGSRLVAYFRDDDNPAWQAVGPIAGDGSTSAAAIEAAAKAGLDARRPRAEMSWTPSEGWATG
jgi:hypothetical protein